VEVRRAAAGTGEPENIDGHTVWLAVARR
jgi:hypothetical protein